MARGIQREHGRKFFRSLPPHRKHVNDKVDCDVVNWLKHPRDINLARGQMFNFQLPKNPPSAERTEDVTEGVAECTNAARAMMLKFCAIDVNKTYKRTRITCLAWNCDECKLIRKDKGVRATGCNQDIKEEYEQCFTVEDRKDEMQRLCEEQGDWKYLGSGNFGLVWEHIPTGYVVKFTGFYRGGCDKYPEYASLSKHLKQVNMPVIHELQYGSNISRYGNAEETYFVILDKLSECCSLRATWAGVFVSYDACNISTRNMENIVKHVPPKDLAQLMQFRDIIQKEKKNGRRLDLHAGNWLVGKDDQLICTDPWC